MALLGELHVRHQPPDPDDGAGAQREERDGHGEAEGQVGVEHVVDRVHPEDHVARDEAQAGQHGDHEAGRHGPLGPLGAGQVLRVGGQLADGDRLVVGFVGEQRPRLGRGRGADDPVPGLPLARLARRGEVGHQVLPARGPVRAVRLTHVSSSFRASQ
jgi:hypothetical protein